MCADMRCERRIKIIHEVDVCAPLVETHRAENLDCVRARARVANKHKDACTVCVSFLALSHTSLLNARHHSRTLAQHPNTHTKIRTCMCLCARRLLRFFLRCMYMRARV